MEDKTISLRAVVTSAEAAEIRKKQCSNEPRVVDVMIEPTMTNHLYGAEDMKSWIWHMMRKGRLKG